MRIHLHGALTSTPRAEEFIIATHGPVPRATEMVIIGGKYYRVHDVAHNYDTDGQSPEVYLLVDREK